MKKEIIITAKTVEEAMSKAYAEHSAEGEVSCEILEMPKKGFLGIGSTPAKVKVVIDDGEDDSDISSIISDLKSMKTVTDKGGDGTFRPEKKPAAKKPNKPAEKPAKPAVKQESAAPVKSEKVAKPQPVKIQEKKPVEVKTDAPKTDAPKAEKKPEAPKIDAPKAEKKPEAPRAEAPKKILTDEEKKQKYEPVSDVEMQFALDFVETVLRDLEIEATAISVKDGDGDYVGINIIGENTGALIGHHGETLDAIQYLANLSASRRSPTPNREFLKITVDIENYRAKREETLRSLARRMAAKAVKYKRNFVLEPMNPYERRIIHSEIQGIENVDTHSVGSDENRKVVVTYEGADKQDRRSGNRRRKNDRRDRAVSEGAPVSETAFETAPAAEPQHKGPTVLFDSSATNTSVNSDGWKKL